MFLPGAHTLDKSIYFYTSGNHSLTITALDETCSLEDLKVNISCEKDANIRLEDFGEVSLACLNLYSCALVCHSSSLLSVDQVFLNGALLRANSTKASFTNIKVGPHEESERNGQIRMRFTKAGTVSNVVFAHNTLPDNFRNNLLHVHDSSDVTVTNCSFYDNAINLESRGIVHLHGSQNVNFTDCAFYNNRKTALYAFDSIFRVSGNISFVNNSDYEGGAMALISAQMQISTLATVLFQDNHAQHVGGAIFSTAADIRDPEPFCPLLFEASNSSFLSSKLDFINNTAVDGGSAIYGILLSQMLCLNAIETSDHRIQALSEALSISPNEPSAVSSDPLRVCICENSTPNCLSFLPQDNKMLRYTVYPGQNFTISAAVMGLNFAPISGSVFANFIDSDASLTSELQRVQRVTHTGCSDLRYSVISNRKTEMLVLTTDGRMVTGVSRITAERAIHMKNSNNSNGNILSDGTFASDHTDLIFRLAGNVVTSLQTAPVFISVTLLDCPPGFILSGNPGQCTCDPVLLENNVTCNIDDQTIRRYRTTWVNNGSSTGGVIFHRHCPFDYCRPEAVDVNLTQPDTQCAFNRSGTLCGACKPGLSLALGSPQCKQCSNRNISLLIVFALAGLALVFLIKVLNLTVAEGTINGLIFYANIVKASESAFFPAVHSNFLPFLSVFISWLNLDLGVESCFFDGLNGYWKSWLQFVFPFYVWLIAALIIVASHYSTRATKIFGSSSVPVLATLIFLSYAKVLRTLIAIFTFTSVRYPNGSNTTVWTFDGNVEYFGALHFPLFFFSILVILVLCLPYIFILLSAGWLRQYLYCRGLHWMVPFFDAYFGPLKSKRFYWVGLLLLVRAVLFIFFAVFFAFESNVNLLLIAVGTVCILTFLSLTGFVYKKLYVTILENSFFLNLVVLVTGTLFINATGGDQEALTIVSVGFAFLQFCGVMIFHCYKFVAKPLWFKLHKRKSYEDRAELLPVALTADTPEEDDKPSEVTYSVISVAELREAAEARVNNEESTSSSSAGAECGGREVGRLQLESCVSVPERNKASTPSEANIKTRRFLAETDGFL